MIVKLYESRIWKQLQIRIKSNYNSYKIELTYISKYGLNLIIQLIFNLH